MNTCGEPLDEYLKCIKQYDKDFVKTHMCKKTLEAYNDCVLGKGKWAEIHKNNEFLATNLSAERIRAVSDISPYIT